MNLRPQSALMNNILALKRQGLAVVSEATDADVESLSMLSLQHATARHGSMHSGGGGEWAGGRIGTRCARS